jgi:hypothetical protein
MAAGERPPTGVAAGVTSGFAKVVQLRASGRIDRSIESRAGKSDRGST